MPDVAIFGHVGYGGVGFRTDQPVHWITFAKFWVGTFAEWAIVSRPSVLMLGLRVKRVHGGISLLSGIPQTTTASAIDDRIEKARIGTHRLEAYGTFCGTPS
jgi:hypothetical protein